MTRHVTHSVTLSTPTTSVPPHAAFAARLKSARLRSGKSQESIAVEVGTSRRHWIRWERGDHLPSQQFIARIAEATGQTTTFLNGSDTPAASEDDSEADPMADLMNAIRRLVRDEMRAAA